MGLISRIKEFLGDRAEKDFNKWTLSWEIKDPRYFRDMTAPYEQLDYSHIAISLVKNKSKVLSAGCGYGREVRFLVKERYCEVTAIDHSAKMIEGSKKLEPKAKYYIADASKFVSNQKFDYVLCLHNTINYLSNIKARRKFIINSYNNLKDGGILIIVTTNAFSSWGKLLRRILSGKDFQYFPLQIDEWFAKTKFKVSRVRLDRAHLILAEKQSH